MLFQTNSNTEVIFPDSSWLRFLNAEKSGSITPKELEKIKSIRITAQNSLFTGTVSLEIVKAMPNLTELICHYDDIVSFAPISHCPKLKRVYIKSSACTQKSLTEIAGSASVKELGLIDMNIENPDVLVPMKLKTLSLTRCRVYGSLEKLKTLSELRIDSVKIDEKSGIAQLAKLKKLSVQACSIDSFAFAANLPLEELKVNGTVVDPREDSLIAEIRTLKDTDWPFSDLTLIRGRAELHAIGIHAVRAKEFAALAESSVTSVTVGHAKSDEEAEKVIEAAAKYRPLQSWGWSLGS